MGAQRDTEVKIMRIRTIKPEFWNHPRLMRLDHGTRLLAIGLLNMADDEGYFVADEFVIRGALMPVEESTTCRRMIDDLSTIGWIKVVETEDMGRVGKVVNFTKHQRIDRAKGSKLKSYYSNGSEIIDDQSTTNRRRIDDQSTLEQGTGNRERNGTGKGTEGGSGGSAKASRVSHFKKPTMDEWKNYCRELNKSWPDPDVESAYDHYEANGWIRGKTKVKDWKACARTCYRNWQERNPNYTTTEYLTENENGELEW